MSQVSATSDSSTVQAFDEIFEAYRPPIYGYLRRLSQDPAQADDLTQEAFVRVHRGLSDFRGDSSLKTWLYRIARNVFLDHSRRASTRREEANLPLESPSGTYVNRPDEASPRPDQAADRNEMSECVRDHTRALPDSYRDVLVLRDMQDLKNQEIADILGISLATAKMRLHRARTKLRESLETDCDFEHDERGVFVCETKEPDDSPRAPSQ